MRLKIIFLVVVVLSSTAAIAQTFQVGAMGGATLLVGDYPSYSFDNAFKILANPGFGLFLRRPIQKNLGVKASLYATSFQGDDRLYPINLGSRNPSLFKYPVVEMQITADYSPFGVRLASRLIRFYLLAGIGFTKTSIKVPVDNDCPVVNLSIPAGLGIRTDINEKMTFFIQAEYVQGLNDCLEDYAGPTNTKDLYGSIKLGVAYLVAPNYYGTGRNIGCPRF